MSVLGIMVIISEKSVISLLLKINISMKNSRRELFIDMVRGTLKSSHAFPMFYLHSKKGIGLSKTGVTTFYCAGNHSPTLIPTVKN